MVLNTISPLSRGRAVNTARPPVLTSLARLQPERSSVARSCLLLVVPLLPGAVLSFPQLMNISCGRKHPHAEIPKHTTDAVVPGIFFMRIAGQVKRDLVEFLDQFPIGVDAAFRGRVHVAITPPDPVAARGVWMTERDQGGRIRAQLAC